MILLQMYFLVGILYVFVNGYVRRLDLDGDWSLPFVWMFLWPLCFIALFVMWIGKRINKF